MWIVNDWRSKNIQMSRRDNNDFLFMKPALADIVGVWGIFLRMSDSTLTTITILFAFKSCVLHLQFYAVVMKYT